eukprot:TRINITY_DN112178_c0_g1_i1.p1 TRINITY_DN112178_c0_g1~~TRINITY_DN112178_c0_g1_i1.p1  ORF type:complete len:664 (+),score=159.20 TRINITY_DN112178_c0_g1_i1:143-2134(+)
MQHLMNPDDGGRRAECIGLKGSDSSPAHRLSSLGSTPYAEPVSLQRHSGEYAYQPEDSRKVREDHGHVLWHPENRVPDVGGLGWRTKTGHLLKNQAYYSQKDKVNKWDDPTHAGVTTWQDWHGPKMRTDAEMMERLDHFDKQLGDWEAKKLFVNTTRVETLDRFYNRKLERQQKESASSWAPHNRARREISSHHETFFGNLDEKPQKELKKVLTKTCLKRDRDAVRMIAQRMQNEKTWSMVYKQMEQERRQDIMADLQMRQSQNDMLMQMSGQPVRQREQRAMPASHSERSLQLAAHREQAFDKNITMNTDFRGLFHADNGHALEALYPGFGHDMVEQFKSRASQSTNPGFPPPPAAQTPRRERHQSAGATGTAKDFAARTEAIARHSIPSSPSRMGAKIQSRFDDHTYQSNATAQSLPTSAPPPPDQSKVLCQENFSPATTMRDPRRVTGDFARTKHYSGKNAYEGEKHSGKRGQEWGHVPPPRKPYTYPVLAPTSPTSKMQPGVKEVAWSQYAMDEVVASPKATQTALGFFTDPDAPAADAASLRRNASAPSSTMARTTGSFDMPVSPKGQHRDRAPTLSFNIPGSMAGPIGHITNPRATATSFGITSNSSMRMSKAQSMQSMRKCKEVCGELDNFDENMQERPRISNFFGTPRKQGEAAC